MSLTPRQATAFSEFAERLNRMAMAEALSVEVTGSRGDKKAIDRMVKELEA